MNFVKRAFLSVKARKGKSILQVFVFTVICVLVLAGLSIQTAAEKSGDLARQKLGADVALQADMEKLREQAMSQQQSGGGNGYVSSQCLSRLMQQRNWLLMTRLEAIIFTHPPLGWPPILSRLKASRMQQTHLMKAVKGRSLRGMPGGMMQGVAFTDSVAEFMDGTSSIVEGTGITEEHIGKNVALIEQTLAEENELGVGDEITVTNPRDETAVMELEVSGSMKWASCTGINMKIKNTIS
ncbi:hypothetical protein V7200_02300 [Cytobacillus firmus]|uniref:ABC transporter, permease protein n=1 Tax=Cytobacillus firmus TaxID=1399 RepID=A0A800MXG3_CYTFI|nr:hypothetical protein [Cytobacillus firmus]KAF0824207.1 ABC transporter, permease protein [Cytobacillus firmus]